MDVTAMIYARIAGAGLALDTFNGAPAIFSDRAPDAYMFAAGNAPVVVIAPPTDDDSADTYTEDYRQIVQDVRVYAYDGGSSSALDAIGRAVRDLFDNQEAALVLDGGAVILANASGPTAAPTTDAAVLGRRVALTLLIQEI